MRDSSAGSQQAVPNRCVQCGKGEVCPAVISYEAEVKHDGRLLRFPVPELHVLQCGACGEVFFDAATDAQISEGLRRHLKLLSPQEIRDGIQSLGLSQRQFADMTGIAPETISRWLSGAYIQSRAMNTLMQMTFERGPMKNENADKGGVTSLP